MGCGGGREGGREGECGGILDRGHQAGVRINYKAVRLLFLSSPFKVIS